VLARRNHRSRTLLPAPSYCPRQVRSGISAYLPSRQWRELGCGPALNRPHDRSALRSSARISRWKRGNSPRGCKRYIGEYVPSSTRMASSLSKIIPFSLTDLLNLSDKVRSQPTTSGGQKFCHVSGKTEEAVLKCARCLLHRYCGKVSCRHMPWIARLLICIANRTVKRRTGKNEGIKGVQASQSSQGILSPRLEIVRGLLTLSALGIRVKHGRSMADDQAVKLT
jgi:hypothetical protein